MKVKDFSCEIFLSLISILHKEVLLTTLLYHQNYSVKLSSFIHKDSIALEIQCLNAYWKSLSFPSDKTKLIKIYHNFKQYGDINVWLELWNLIVSVRKEAIVWIQISVRISLKYPTIKTSISKKKDQVFELFFNREPKKECWKYFTWHGNLAVSPSSSFKTYKQWAIKDYHSFININLKSQI